jgi:methyl coenzyme M reductase subunit C-like uncharacterized protein (methanogenesis marker protein 7)
MAISAHHLPRRACDVINGNQVHSVAISAHHLPWRAGDIAQTDRVSWAL